MKHEVTKRFLESLITKTEENTNDDAFGAIRFSVVDNDYSQLGEIMGDLFFMIEEESGIKTNHTQEYDGHYMFESMMEEAFYGIFSHVGMITNEQFDVVALQNLIDNLDAYNDCKMKFEPSRS